MTSSGNILAIHVHVAMLPSKSIRSENCMVKTHWCTLGLGLSCCCANNLGCDALGLADAGLAHNLLGNVLAQCHTPEQ